MGAAALGSLSALALACVNTAYLALAIWLAALAVAGMKGGPK